VGEENPLGKRSLQKGKKEVKVFIGKGLNPPAEGSNNIQTSNTSRDKKKKAGNCSFVNGGLQRKKDWLGRKTELNSNAYSVEESRKHSSRKGANINQYLENNATRWLIRRESETDFSSDPKRGELSP